MIPMFASVKGKLLKVLEPHRGGTLWLEEGEAGAKLATSLLQAQFPQPLDEIEAELVRNRRWEGKPVHTTRDGGHVVVESQWTLGLSRQPEAAVEINQRFTDCEMDTEACTDSPESRDRATAGNK
jgi:hypothetical protein